MCKPSRFINFGFICVLSITPFLAKAESIVYSSSSNPLPPNLPSFGYEANQTSEFGDLISFAGTARFLTSVDVTMSNWALESTYEAVGTSPGFDMTLTLNLYSAGTGNSVGPLISTQDIVALIPWRPEADPACANPSQWKAGNGGCYNGLASTVTFFMNHESVPDSIIYGLAYNTGDNGYNPIGVAGPYNSLNFGVSFAPPSVGTDTVTGTGYYADKTSVFQESTGWTYTGAISFNADPAVPEPGTVGLMGAGLAGLLWGARRRFSRTAA
jgi:PEP-CTERM motif